MQALLAPLLAAAQRGEEVQPHLDAFREQLVEAAPDQAEAIDQFLTNLTSQLADGGEQP